MSDCGYVRLFSRNLSITIALYEIEFSVYTLDKEIHRYTAFLVWKYRDIEDYIADYIAYRINTWIPLLWIANNKVPFSLTMLLIIFQVVWRYLSFGRERKFIFKLVYQGFVHISQRQIFLIGHTVHTYCHLRYIC